MLFVELTSLDSIDHLAESGVAQPTSGAGMLVKERIPKDGFLKMPLHDPLQTF